MFRISLQRVPRAANALAMAAVAKPSTTVAMLHISARTRFVAASQNASTSPSTPLPPPMTSNSTTASKSAPSIGSSTTSSQSSTPSSTAAISDTTEDLSSEDTLPNLTSSGFAPEHFVPVSLEEARSLTANPILSQLVNTIMKDGKKARAQRFVADALLEIRTRTHGDPYKVVMDALKLTSPILKLMPIKKGSKILQVPTPMTERQQRRKAIVWILEASDKRKGEKLFKDRLASEFLAVINGNSGALAKKNTQHKMALANRANASLKY